MSSDSFKNLDKLDNITYQHYNTYKKYKEKTNEHI